MGAETLASETKIPAHIPAERVFDFDIYSDPTKTNDLHGWIASIVKKAPPVFYTPRNGGHWVIAGHEELFNAARDTEIFSSHHMSIPVNAAETRQIPISLDPPEHGIYRAVLARAFAPKTISALEGNIRALANSLIDKVIDKGRCDFVPAIAEPLPVLIFMKMMGLPLERMPEFRSWVADALGKPEKREAAYGEISKALIELIEARQKKREDDLISVLIDGDIEGRKPTRDELLAFGILLVIAGLDTVMMGLSFGIRHLAMDQEAQARLRADPALISEAAEELLRRYTFTSPGRTVMRDTEFAGAPLKKDDRVLLLLAAGDLDPRSFPDPEKFDVERANKTHIAFNSGPHRCLGSHLARLELNVLYQEWLRRVPTFRIDGPVKFHGGQVFGIDTLPLAWDK